MYVVTWFDGCSKQRSVCAPNSETAWEICWALLKWIEKTTPVMDAWLYVTCDGYWYDPETGANMRPCEAGYRMILAKGRK